MNMGGEGIKVEGEDFNCGFLRFGALKPVDDINRVGFEISRAVVNDFENSFPIDAIIGVDGKVSEANGLA